jgi:hypothetical protein
MWGYLFVVWEFAGMRHMRAGHAPLIGNRPLLEFSIIHIWPAPYLQDCCHTQRRVLTAERSKEHANMLQDTSGWGVQVFICWGRTRVPKPTMKKSTPGHRQCPSCNWASTASIRCSNHHSHCHSHRPPSAGCGTTAAYSIKGLLHDLALSLGRKGEQTNKKETEKKLLPFRPRGNPPLTRPQVRRGANDGRGKGGGENYMGIIGSGCEHHHH